METNNNDQLARVNKIMTLANENSNIITVKH